MSNPKTAPGLELINRPTATDLVFSALYEQVVTLRLPPGSKLSEAEVSKATGVSRQPVRDAFFRLSKLGFFVIRPQRPTTVSLISVDAVRQSRLVRMAVETEVARIACENASPEDIQRLEDILSRQQGVDSEEDPLEFHSLDDAFHREISEIAKAPLAWEVVQEKKAHMDRVRFLSLEFDVERTLAEHRAVLDAFVDRDPEKIAEKMRMHLSHIEDQIPRIREAHPEYFNDDE